jgi:hypothetical protein
MKNMPTVYRAYKEKWKDHSGNTWIVNTRGKMEGLGKVTVKKPIKKKNNELKLGWW